MHSPTGHWDAVIQHRSSNIGREAMMEVKNGSPLLPQKPRRCHKQGVVPHFLTASKSKTKHIVRWSTKSYLLWPSIQPCFGGSECSFRGQRSNPLGWRVLLFPLAFVIHFAIRTTALTCSGVGVYTRFGDLTEEHTKFSSL